MKKTDFSRERERERCLRVFLRGSVSEFSRERALSSSVLEREPFRVLERESVVFECY